LILSVAHRFKWFVAAGGAREHLAWIFERNFVSATLQRVEGAPAPEEIAICAPCLKRGALTGRRHDGLMETDLCDEYLQEARRRHHRSESAMARDFGSKARGARSGAASLTQHRAF